MAFMLLFGLWIVLGLFSSSYAYHPASLPDIEDEHFIQDCVEQHNNFRSKVNPLASNMRMMTWDSALAKTAKAWAKKCHFGHNIYLETPRKVHPTFTPVGENIWTGSFSLFSVGKALRDWYNEVNDYTFESNSCTKVCGHYTQIVWATSYKVGCAVQFCQRVTNTGITNGAHFVCNYGPAGNYPTKPYKSGRPCSDCMGEKCIQNLCENPERDQLRSYFSWSPDWDITKSSPKAPSYSTPSHSACDSSCIAVLVLRISSLLITFGTVVLLSKRYPQMFIYE
ncbi:glioma pathogenesis-related protein 1 [Anolis carolinensis]|uniref:glioma pathogenesis-related protein 1 n=1 Tax=Anolis carolinensis TaxID=28377 RepID=UPI002F2B23B1